MSKYLLYVILFLSLSRISYSQENGVVALDLPVRNSLKFNRHVVNPTFSFVREQNKYISFSNKRQWMQFENAPQAYLFGFSGRIKENIGAGVSLFQQDFGVQTTFGGILNFAYNAVINRENNLTFGLNIGAYQSSINEGNVISNFPDPALQNLPKNLLLTVNPGINYGTEFFDFGVSVNNLVSYNFNTSKLIEDNPELGYQAHIMYTGYMDSRGFFDEAKFSSLITAELKEETTVFSGLAMLSIPKGLWGQIGYNTLYGASAGLGINISEQIAVEYNFEKSLGELSGFGSSHEFTLAYRFKNNSRYLYNGDDEEKSVFATKRRKRSVAKRNTSNNKTRTPDRRKIANTNNNDTPVASDKPKDNVAEDSTTQTEVVENKTSQSEEESRIQEATNEAERIEKDRLEAQAEKEKKEAEEKARLEEERKARIEAERQKAAAEEKARLEAERIKNEELERAKKEAEAKEEERIRAELLKKKQEEEEKARIEAERQKAEAEEKARLEAERIRNEELEQAKIEEEARRRAEEAQAQQLPEVDEETAESINDLNKTAEASNNSQKDLIKKLTEKVAIKQKDLDDLKEENDLSEQGIVVAPKAFKSVTAENAEIENLKERLDKVIEEQRIKIEELEAIYITRKRKVRDDKDPLNAAYLKAINELKEQQLTAIKTKSDLEASLVTIKAATEEERKRRIKRAAYDNQKDRFNKDSLALARIKKFTEESTEKLTESDFDFGEERNNSNIEIVKNVSHSESGYYMVIAVHDSEAKRDEFLKKMVASGRKDVNFFFDVNSNKYFIYYDKFDNIGQAQRSLQNKENEPYNAKMSIVKIEN
ncbi:PorP/SprF family type IX secretion system membrane protein [Seonamhaeicola marinus]|uniref:Type IX secretion system membrane protein PorP/SprF n=1 Tax=Seonamhaeicola marinus TaxID=1912246 RepID=A0A5D0HL48_9FLAO|nr:PorP/SprF family type IX secretion system membrane protein [Seonamhaeicola marinus]TYA72008.1 type IX secretion system membrane protein PorP/SprF [Seonamhaeicola marinus]